jgi:hypothetical protein
MHNPHRLTYHKADNDLVTLENLADRTERLQASGYDVPKWMLFCATLLQEGYTCLLYEARDTYSKYITVTHEHSDARAYKVRFSNHKPSWWREQNNDCDFFVGVSHKKVTTTQQALEAVRNHFQVKGVK